MRGSQAAELVAGIEAAQLGDVVGGGMETLTRSRRGSQVGGRPTLRLAVFEITAYWEWVSNTDRAATLPSVPEQMHRAFARPVIYFPSPDQEWDGTERRRPEYIYHHTGYSPESTGSPATAIREQQREENTFLPRSGVGDWVWCQFDEQSGRWLAVEPWEKTWRFKLTEDLAAGPANTATAKLVLMRSGWGASEDGGVGLEYPTDIEFEVSNPLYLPGRMVTGCVGYARRFADSGLFEVVSCRGAATMIRGLLTADLATTDSSFKIDGVTVLQPCGAELAEGDLDGSDEATIYNADFEWESDEDAVCYALWDQANNRFNAFQVKCKA